MPTIAEEYILSTLEETGTISNKDGYRISIVKDSVDGVIYVKKQFKTTAGINTYKALLKIEHVNLPKTFHVIETKDGFFVLEEYIHGATLKTALTGESLPVEKVADIAIQLCEVLELLHNTTPPLIHRDVNPSNIIVTADGIVKLIDFNAAKEYKPSAVEDTTTLGTKAYAAPEQYGYAKTDSRTDIYCLGATMYHMLTGKIYVNGGKIPKGKIPIIIQRCLQIDPDKRYSSASALRMDLEYALPRHYKLNSNKKRSSPFLPDLQFASPIKKILLSTLYIFLAANALLWTYIVMGMAQNMRDVVELGTFLVVVFYIPYFLICNVWGIRRRLPLFREGGIVNTIIGTLVMAVLLLIAGFVGIYFASLLG